MTAGDFYRIEFRIQNSVHKYYLVREIFSDSRKYSASRLITSGTPPTRTEINRCASLYGFDLELKCITKAAKYRAETFRYDIYNDIDAVIELERFRLLVARRRKLLGGDAKAEGIAARNGVEFTADEIRHMMETGVIPAGKNLASVNLVQNLWNTWDIQNRGLTISALYKLHAALSANIRPPLSPEYRPALKKRLSEFSQKLKNGFYPFEQCLLLYQDLQEMLPEEAVFTEEVYAKALAHAGYSIFPCDAETFEAASAFVKAQNPILEQEVRRLNEAKFTVKTGGKQKTLDLE